MSSASSLESGTWSSRWGAWFVRLRWQPEGWRATVWCWPPREPLSARLEIESAAELYSAVEAAEWAGQVMVREGARVMVLDAPSGMSFASLLDFSPAPEGVA